MIKIINSVFRYCKLIEKKSKEPVELLTILYFNASQRCSILSVDRSEIGIGNDSDDKTRCISIYVSLKV